MHFSAGWQALFWCGHRPHFILIVLLPCTPVLSIYPACLSSAIALLLERWLPRTQKAPQDKFYSACLHLHHGPRQDLLFSSPAALGTVLGLPHLSLLHRNVRHEFIFSVRLQSVLLRAENQTSPPFPFSLHFLFPPPPLLTAYTNQSVANIPKSFSFVS